MTKEELTLSVSQRKLLLTKGQKIKIWINILLLSFFLGSPIYVILSEEIKAGRLSFTAVILVGLMVLLIRSVLMRPVLNVYKSNLSSDQFKLANKAAATIDKWHILVNKDHFFEAIQSVNWQRDGIKITAIHMNGKLYLNSMVNPSEFSNPFTFGQNNKNKNLLLQLYQDILKDEDVLNKAKNLLLQKEEDFWNESEWSIKSILKRIIGYGLVTFFSFLAYLFFTEVHALGVIYTFIILGVCAGYIYFDIKVIVEKMRRKLQKKSS